MPSSAVSGTGITAPNLKLYTAGEYAPPNRPASMITTTAPLPFVPDGRPRLTAFATKVDPATKLPGVLGAATAPKPTKLRN